MTVEAEWARAAATSALDEGEKLVGICRATRVGQRKRVVIAVLVSAFVPNLARAYRLNYLAALLVVALVGTFLASRPKTSDNVLGFPFMVLAVTDKRLVAFQRDWLRIPPTSHIVATIPRSDVTAVEATGGRELTVILTLTARRRAAVVIHPRDRREGHALAEALAPQPQ